MSAPPSFPEPAKPPLPAVLEPPLPHAPLAHASLAPPSAIEAPAAPALLDAAPAAPPAPASLEQPNDVRAIGVVTIVIAPTLGGYGSSESPISSALMNATWLNDGPSGVFGSTKGVRSI